MSRTARIHRHLAPVPLRRLAATAAVVAGLVATLLGTAPSTAPVPAGYSSASTVTAAPWPGISLARVTAHLSRFQAIAYAHNGNRYTGTAGYRASLRYVKHQLDVAGFRTSVQQFMYNNLARYNLIADWPGGDPARVVMAGAHLDSSPAGPGINDNASGSAAILETALTVARTHVHPAKHLRFAWWDAEEIGLVGSRYYVDSLSMVQRSRISSYLNFDMIASPNAGYFVYNDDPRLEALFTGWFAARGIPTEPSVEIIGRSDHAPFKAAGIPVGGLFTGAGALKTPEQVRKWGGVAGRPYDSCYHSACDTLSNINRTALRLNSNAIGYAVWVLGGHTARLHRQPSPVAPGRRPHHSGAAR